MVTKELAAVLKNFIVANKDLKHLLLPGCDPSGQLLEEILCDCRMLEYLDISYNVISDLAAYDLSTIINQSASLQYLNMNKCTITENGKEMITKAMQDIEYLQDSVMDNIAPQSINMAIISNSMFFIFSLSNLQILADLETFNPMYYIKFTPCCTTEKLSKYIGSAFSSEEIVHLSILNCDLRECGTFVILEEAKHINTLQYIILRSSRVPQEAMDDVVMTILSNVGIKHFDVSDCELSESQITAIVKALSNLSGLQYLDISHNAVSEEAAVEIESVIINNTSLEYLNVSTCGLQDNIISRISQALSNITSIISLDISTNKITTVETTNHLVVAVHKQTKLQTVNFSNCFEGEIIYNFLHGFKTTRILKSINLESNSICFSSANVIKFFLSENAVIEYLNLSNCGIAHVGLLNILSHLGQLATLQHLILSSNSFTESMTRSVKAIIGSNKKLKHIDLSNCKLSPLQLISFLVSSCYGSIQHLNLSLNNSDSNLDVDNVNLTTPENDKLTHLNLSHCSLPCSAVNHIFMLLSQCTSLTHLNLHSCAVTKHTSLKSFLCHSLQYLNMCNCSLEGEQITEIVECLRENESFQYLLLSSNVITNMAAEQMSSLIISSTSLRQLALSDCELEEIGMLHVSQSLQKISSLGHLDLSYNIISEKAATSIASALSKNTSLQCLNMSYCTWPNNGLAIIQSTLDFQKFKKLKEADFSTW